MIDVTSTRTVGIDLAAQPKSTAACVIDWTLGAVAIEHVEVGVDDDAIITAAATASVVAIDSPFGWPVAFAKAVGAYAVGGPWAPDGPLWLRVTDVAIAPVKRPLSVSSDRIAVPAARAAALLSRLGPDGRAAARDGADRIIEVYPAAALQSWGFVAAGYKRPDGGSIRAALLDGLVSQMPWLDIGRWGSLFARSDHAIDAFVAALVGRAFALGLAIPPTAEQGPFAAAEGWIWLPVVGPAGLLGGQG